MRVFKLGKLFFLKAWEKTRQHRPEKKEQVSSPAPGISGAPDYNAEGWKCIAAQRYADAVAWFTTGLKIDPRAADCYLGLGRVYLEQAQPEEAIRWLMKGLDIHPEDCAFYDGIAQVYLRQRALDDALYWFKKGLAINPQNSRLCVGLGWLCREQKQYAEALMWFNKGIAADPKNISGYMGAAIAQYCLDKDYAKAKTYAVNGLRMDSKGHNWFNIFVGQLEPSERRDLLEELAQEHLLPEHFLQGKDYTAWELVNKDKNFDRRLQQWITVDIERMVVLCKGAGSKVLLLGYPIDYPTHINQLLRSFAAAHSLPFIDNAEIFSELLRRGAKYEDYFVPDTHCNADGYHVMARSIVDKLSREKMFDFGQQ